MFDWISDAIDWISDGISSLWDNTVGAAADAISDAIWDIMFEWIFNKVYGLIAELFTFINETATDIFALSWYRCSLDCLAVLRGCFLSAGLL